MRQYNRKTFPAKTITSLDKDTHGPFQAKAFAGKSVAIINYNLLYDKVRDEARRVPERVALQ